MNSRLKSWNISPLTGDFLPHPKKDVEMVVDHTHPFNTYNNITFGLLNGSHPNLPHIQKKMAKALEELWEIEHPKEEKISDRLTKAWAEICQEYSRYAETFELIPHPPVMSDQKNDDGNIEKVNSAEDLFILRSKDFPCIGETLPAHRGKNRLLNALSLMEDRTKEFDNLLIELQQEFEFQSRMSGTNLVCHNPVLAMAGTIFKPYEGQDLETLPPTELHLLKAQMEQLDKTFQMFASKHITTSTGPNEEKDENGLIETTYIYQNPFSPDDLQISCKTTPKGRIPVTEYIRIHNIIDSVRYGQADKYLKENLGFDVKKDNSDPNNPRLIATHPFCDDLTLDVPDVLNNPEYTLMLELLDALGSTNPLELKQLTQRSDDDVSIEEQTQLASIVKEEYWVGLTPVLNEATQRLTSLHDQQEPLLENALLPLHGYLSEKGKLGFGSLTSMELKVNGIRDKFIDETFQGLKLRGQDDKPLFIFSQKTADQIIDNVQKTINNCTTNWAKIFNELAAISATIVPTHINDLTTQSRVLIQKIHGYDRDGRPITDGQSLLHNRFDCAVRPMENASVAVVISPKNQETMITALKKIIGKKTVVGDNNPDRNMGDEERLSSQTPIFMLPQS